MAQDDGAAFSGAAGNTPLDVPYTTAYTDYTSTGPGDDHGSCQGQNNGQNTCTHTIDVTNIVKEITARPGWTSTSAMRFVLLSTDAAAPNVYTGYEDYSANPAKAATLLVNPPAPTIVSSGAWGTSAQSTYPTTYSTGPFVYPGASTLLLFLGDYYNFRSLPVSQPTVSDSCGNTWNILAGPTNWAGIIYDIRSTVYYVQSPASCPAGDTITITVNNQEPIYVHFLAVTGSDSTQPPAVSAITSPSPGTYTTSATSNPVTLTNSGLLVSWIFGDSDAPHTFTPQTGFVTDVNSTPGYLTAVTENVSSPGSYQSQFSISPSDGWQVVMIGLSAPVAAAPAITSATTANGVVGTAFSYQITATNSPTSYGATGLPAGLTVDSQTGLISGTPTAAGTSTVALSATNSAGTGNATLTLTVNQATPTITWATPAAITYGTPLSATQLDATASVPGTFVYTPDPGTFEPVGTDTLSVAFVPADLVDYITPPPATVSLIVLPTIPAVLPNPCPTGILGPGPVTFSWTTGSGPAAYSLSVGAGGAGWTDLYAISNTTLTSATVDIPADGVTVWTRFFQYIAGVTQYTDYVCTESGTLIPAAIQSPTTGTPLSGTVTFNWAGGAGPSFYQLLVGTQGVGTADLLNTGNTQETSQAVTIPADGVNVYVRLNQRIDGAWQSIDYIYTESGTSVPAVLTSPSPGSTLTGTSATFQWPGGVGPAQYQLLVGTKGVGSDDLYYSGNTMATQETVNNIPQDGVTVFVMLRQQIDGSWVNSNYTYTEAGTIVPAAISSPAPGATLPSGSVNFNWAGGVGPSEYRLLLGTTGVGSQDLYYSGVITATSETVTVPANGVTLFVRLYQMINGIWQSTDYTYTEAGTIVPAAITAPTPGTTLPSGAVAFTWSAGTGPAQYQLLVGTAGFGSYDVYYSGNTNLTSETVTIPSNGVTLFVMLRQQINGSWINSNYTYTEAGTIVPAAITAPTPGTTLPSGPVAFTWSAGTGPTQYQLLVGTTGFGSYDVYYSGNTKLTSETVTIPSNGVTLFVMLRQQINGSWVNSNYTYTEPGTIVPAAITSPTPGTTLPSGPVAFTWSAGTGPVQYQLLVGTAGFGSYDVYYSGNTNLTSETVTIPSNGVKLFVMLRQQINGSWINSDYTYTEQ